MSIPRSPEESRSTEPDADAAYDFVLRNPENRGSYNLFDFYESSRYEIGNHQMTIYDAVWGEEVIDARKNEYDELLVRLARTPLLRRTQAIEQLTLGQDFATIPNTMYMSRWSHIWGSVVFIRKMNQGKEVDARESMVMQLRTLLSDVGHTAFSHLGDWMFQPAGGAENLHDIELKDILEATGITALLQEAGFSVDEVVFPKVKDWVEAPMPDINVDRVDFGNRETSRWQDSFTGLNYFKRKLMTPQKLFEVTDDNMLAIKDPDYATRFTIGYSLLPTEHWQHPIHRLQLQLFELAIRNVVASRLSVGGGHPREAMYDVDPSFNYDLQTWEVMTLVTTMKRIGLSQRRFFAQGRKNDLDAIFRGANEPFGTKIGKDFVFPNFPNPLEMKSWQSEEFVVPHDPHLVVETVDSIDADPITVVSHGLQFALPALKSRSIDPLLVVRGKQQRLSEYNPSYGPYLEGQRAEMGKHFLVTILMNEEVARSIVDKDQKTKETWQELLKRTRSAKRLGEIVNSAEGMSASHSIDRISEV